MNVISIDLDVLVNGHTFAKYMNYDIDPEDSWNCIYYLEQTDKYGIDTKLDYRALGIILDILKIKCNGADVRVIDEHNQIIDVMKELQVKDCDMYNFDAHHDIDYGNDNSELTIENWVLHGKSNKMINEYNWICRPLSDIRCDSPIKYNRSCIYDLDIDLLPNFDLVVICISHHFTPSKYWDKLINILKIQEVL